jgi:hypothetical protein
MSSPLFEFHQLHEFAQEDPSLLPKEIADMHPIAKKVNEEVGLLFETLPYISAGVSETRRQISSVSESVKNVKSYTETLRKTLQAECKNKTSLTCTEAKQNSERAIYRYGERKRIEREPYTRESKLQEKDKAISDANDIATICEVYQQQALQVDKETAEARAKSVQASKKATQCAKTVTEVNVKLLTQQMRSEEVTASAEKLTQTYKDAAKVSELAMLYERVSKTYTMVVITYEQKRTNLQQRIDAYVEAADAHKQLAEADDEYLSWWQKRDDVLGLLAQALEEKARSCEFCEPYERARLVRVSTMFYAFWSMQPSRGREDDICRDGVKVVLEHFFGVRFYLTSPVNDPILQSPSFRRYVLNRQEVSYLLPSPPTKAKGAEKPRNCPKLYRQKTATGMGPR